MKLLSNLAVQIAIAMILGVVVGLSMGQEAAMFAPLGAVFIQLIKMLVIPLVAISVFTGAAAIGSSQSAGKIGGFTFGFYISTSLVAVILGLVLGEVFQPGAGLDPAAVEGAFPEISASDGKTPEFWPLILAFIPANPFNALTSGNILQVLFFCIFFGFGLASLPAERREPVIHLFNTLVEALIWMINKVMIIAPIGVFGLMASSTGTFGYGLLWLLVSLLMVYLLAIAIHWVGFFPLCLKLLSKTPISLFFSKMVKPQIVAFSTASSMATLPVTLEPCEEELKVPNSISSFVLPLGATINMNGNAIYYALVAVFSAQMFGIDLSMGQYVAIMVTATIGSIGQAGVPGPTLLVVAVLVAADIPIEALPLLYAADRLFDMVRTALNITGDAACAVICKDLFPEATTEDDVTVELAQDKARGL